MPDRSSSNAAQLERIETMQSDLLILAEAIEKRLDIFAQEFQRVATAVRRDELKRESRSADLPPQADILIQLSQRLDRIEALLSR